jgi:alpha-D-xyloside xylohydrolase
MNDQVPAVTIKDRELILRFAKQRDAEAIPFALRLTRPQEHTWRIQGTLLPQGEPDFDDLGAAQILARDLGDPIPAGALPFTVSREENRLIISAEDGGYGKRLEVSLAPFSVSAEKGRSHITAARPEGKNWIIAGSLLPPEQEALFGGGERFNQANQRGKRIEMMSVDAWTQTEGNSYVPVPFILSSRSYGLLLNRYERSVLDLGAETADKWTFTLLSAPLDLYLFLDRNPGAILRDYSELSGFAPMPAPWLFGIQVSRHTRLKEFATPVGIEAMIDKMEENRFPWDAIIAEGWQVYSTESYDDLRKIVARVHGLGKKFLVYEACGRVPYSDDAEVQAKITEALGFKPEYLIREPDGNITLPETKLYNPEDSPNPNRSRFVDITNADALRWWQDSVWGRLVEDIGVDGCKIDFCEQIPDHLPLVFRDGRSAWGTHLWYPTLYNTLMYRYYLKHRSEGAMCFSRGGGIGAQRYPFLWAGDQLREFRYLQAILTAILSSGLSGIPFMSYDMAGYMPARDLENNPEDSVFIRGTEMGCFSSNMQTHGIVTRPYDFPDQVKDTYRSYAELHELLRPYLVEQAETACRTGMPLLRHLFLYDPNDPQVPQIEDEYMLGEALLVAPVFSAAETRDIYLPQGAWRNILDGKTYQGKQTLTAFPAPLRQIPVFLLQGNQSKTIDGVLEQAGELIRNCA